MRRVGTALSTSQSGVARIAVDWLGGRRNIAAFQRGGFNAIDFLNYNFARTLVVGNASSAADPGTVRRSDRASSTASRSPAYYRARDAPDRRPSSPGKRSSAESTRYGPDFTFKGPLGGGGDRSRLERTWPRWRHKNGQSRSLQYSCPRD